MKRSALKRRTPLKRGSRRVGQAARERVKAGGPIAAYIARELIELIDLWHIREDG